MQLLEADWPQDILETDDGQNVFGPSTLDGADKTTLVYRGLSIRMGMHIGSPVCELDPITRRMDYFGPVVNKAARVCGAADGGQILVSQDVERAYRKMISNRSDANSSASSPRDGKDSLQSLAPVFIEAGERKLKGFENSEVLVSMWPK